MEIDPTTGKLVGAEPTLKTPSLKGLGGLASFTPETIERLRDLGIGYYREGRITPRAPLAEEEVVEEKVTCPPGYVDDPTTGACVPIEGVGVTQPMELEDIGGEAEITIPTKIAETVEVDQISVAAEEEITAAQTIQDRLDDLEEERKALKVKREALEEPADIEALPSAEEEMEELYKKYRIPEQYDKLLALQPQITTLMNQMNTGEERYQAGMDRIEAQPGMVMAIARGQQQYLKRQWAREKSALASQLGAVTATAEYYRENVEMARGIINDTVQAITFDTRQKVEDYRWLYENYKDDYDALSSDIKGNIDDSFELLLKSLEIEEEKADATIKNMVQYAGAGITFTDTKKEQTAKIVDYLKTAPAKDIAANWIQVTDKEGNIILVNKLTKEQHPLGIEAKVTGAEPLSRSVLNKMNVRGVEDGIALKIQSSLAEGYTMDEIFDVMKEDYGLESAIKYADAYTDVVKGIGKMEVVTEVGVEETYEQRFGIEKDKKKFHWYAPSTW